MALALLDLGGFASWVKLSGLRIFSRVEATLGFRQQGREDSNFRLQDLALYWHLTEAPLHF